MVDAVFHLLDRGHRGHFTALSRRGLLPHRHTDVPRPAAWRTSQPPLPLSELLRTVRRAAAGDDWRAVVDGMRPFLPDLWMSLTPVEKRRFLRHLRPWWDIHRHRLAPQGADRLQQIIANGQIEVVAGQIVGVTDSSEDIRIAYRPRGGSTCRELKVDLVVNCSGPCGDFARIRQPLVRRLLDDGLVRPDPLRLGLEADTSLRLLDHQGRPHSRLYALGPVIRGLSWECTAVPEIRRQAQWLADHLARNARPSPAATVN
jgi:uncharacterized NAD(P)/FAD-binding protein YdhS